MDLLARILVFLRNSEMKTTAFGRAAVNNPRFVGDLLNGRQPRLTTAARVHAWLDRHGAAR